MAPKMQMMTNNPMRGRHPNLNTFPMVLLFFGCCSGVFICWVNYCFSDY